MRAHVERSPRTLALKKRILLVDDDQGIVSAVRLALSAHDYEVTTAVDGVDALAGVYGILPAAIIADRVAELGDLVLGEVADVRVGVDADLREKLGRRRAAAAVDVREADFRTLVQRQVDSSDSCHLPDHP